MGRPVATTHAEIENAAFRLFAERGFAQTTMDAIAAEVGVGRRTLFRYFESKNDIPWGDFPASLASFAEILDATPTETPVAEAVHRGVLHFNDFGDDVMDHHRERMRLILTTPALQAHSVLQYRAWRNVIANFVARRTETSVTDPLPRVVGHVSLALSLAAYEQWLGAEGSRLADHLDRAMSELKRYLQTPA